MQCDITNGFNSSQTPLDKSLARYSIFTQFSRAVVCFSQNYTTSNCSRYSCYFYCSLVIWLVCSNMILAPCNEVKSSYGRDRVKVHVVLCRDFLFLISRRNSKSLHMRYVNCRSPLYWPDVLKSNRAAYGDQQPARIRHMRPTTLGLLFSYSRTMEVQTKTNQRNKLTSVLQSKRTVNYKLMCTFFFFFFNFF